MPKETKTKKDIDFLNLFKKSLALSFTAILFGVQTSYASTINGDTTFNTNVSTNGNNINITGGTLNGDTGFHHFSDFVLTDFPTILNLLLGFLHICNRNEHAKSNREPLLLFYIWAKQYPVFRGDLLHGV